MLVCLLPLTSGPVAAQTVKATSHPSSIPLSPGDFQVHPRKQVSYLFDPTKKATVQSVLSRKQDFRRFDGHWIGFKPMDGVIWLHLSVHNVSNRTEEWLIDLQRIHLDTAKIFIVRDNQSIEPLLNLNRSSSLAQRVYQDRYIAAPLQLGGKESVEILIAYESKFTSSLPLAIATAQSFRAAHTREDRINWTQHGALISAILLALLFGKVISWSLALSFVAVVLLGMGFLINNEGYLIASLYPASPYWVDRAFIPLLVILLIAGVQFIRSFFASSLQDEENGNSPKIISNQASILDKLLTLSLPCLALIGAIASFYFPQRWALYLVIVSALICAIPVYMLFFIALKNKLPGARPLAAGVACASLSFGYFAYALQFPQDFTLSSAQDNAHLCLVLVAISFSAAIVMRLIVMRNNLNTDLATELLSLIKIYEPTRQY